MKVVVVVEVNTDEDRDGNHVRLRRLWCGE